MGICRRVRRPRQTFEELDHQLACQAYVWVLPLVSNAQWKSQHYDMFGAISSDLGRYVEGLWPQTATTGCTTTPRA
jgi:hypothetical protein